jgi:hypothetical protein
MIMFNLNVSCNDSCCSHDFKEDICKICSQKGHSVKEITLKQFIKKPLSDYNGFYFCKNPNCDVIYFNNTSNIYLKKEHINTKVGLKEGKGLICYCFDYKVEDVKQNGQEIINQINQKIKEFGCECEIKNPTGRCCLSDIRAVSKK